MFAGYSTNHAGDVYQFIHVKTNQVIYSRDDQWLQQLWGEYYKLSFEDCLKHLMDPLEGPGHHYDPEQEGPH